MTRFIEIVVVTILFAQVTFSKGLHDFEDNTINTNDVLRSNIWNSIKASAQNAWKLVENLAESTKDKINSWAKNVETSAFKIMENIKATLKDLKDKSQMMLEEMLGKTKIVNKCIKDNENEIEDILKDVLGSVSECIAENIIKLGGLTEYQFKLASNENFNDTAFIEILENEFNSCIKKQDVEECVEIVHKRLFEEINDIEAGILTSRSESRNIADDILDTIVNCSKDGLMNASTSISAETLKIVKCVINNQEVSLYE